MGPTFVDYRTSESASRRKSQLGATTAFSISSSSLRHVSALYIMRGADEDFIRRIMIMDGGGGGGVALPGLRQT